MAATGLPPHSPASTYRMTALERRTSLSLAAIYGLRMLGLFLVLPVFALEAAEYPGGDDPAPGELAIGRVLRGHGHNPLSARAPGLFAQCFLLATGLIAWPMRAPPTQGCTTGRKGWIIFETLEEKTMASVNKVILVGNCGRDPEIRYLPSGQAVANVSVATSTRRKDKNSGESIEDTQWHRVTFYDRLAEIAGEYVKKGQPIYVEGRLKYGKYTDQAGVEKNTVDIIATEMQLLGKREGMGGPGDDGGGGGGGYSRPAPASRPAAPAARPAPASAPSKTGFDDMDDDIPF